MIEKIHVLWLKCPRDVKQIAFLFLVGVAILFALAWAGLWIGAMVRAFVFGFRLAWGG